MDILDLLALAPPFEVEPGPEIEMIVTVNQFKAYWGITASTWDTQLLTLLTGAQAEVERFSSRLYDGATFTELYNGDGSPFLLLRNAPIKSVTSVTYVAPNGNRTVLPATSYRVDSETGELFKIPAGYGRSTSYDATAHPSSEWGNSFTFTSGFQNYEVVYVGGYGTTPTYYAAMPADLQLAMYQYAAWLFAPIVSGEVPNDFQSETIGDYSYTKRSADENKAFLTRLFGRFRRATL